MAFWDKHPSGPDPLFEWHVMARVQMRHLRSQIGLKEGAGSRHGHSGPQSCRVLIRGTASFHESVQAPRSLRESRVLHGLGLQEFGVVLHLLKRSDRSDHRVLRLVLGCCHNLVKSSGFSCVHIRVSRRISAAYLPPVPDPTCVDATPVPGQMMA